jgi:hypothetical protein
VEDIVRIIFEVLGTDFLQNLWDRDDDARDDMIEIIYLTYLIKTRP